MEQPVNKSHSILVLRSVTDVVKKVRETKDPNAAVLIPLKQKIFTSKDAMISLAANQAIITLVEDQILDASALLSEFISLLPTVSYHTGIASAICDLLIKEYQHQKRNKKFVNSNFTVCSLQYPFIILLIRDPDIFSIILKKIKILYKITCDSPLCPNELLYPFYMYVFCNPKNKLSELQQLKLWNFLISVEPTQALKIIKHVIFWFQLSTKEGLSQAFELTSKLFTLDLAIYNREILILWFATIMYLQLFNKFNTDDIFYFLKDNIKIVEMNECASSLICILAKCILISSADCIYEYLDLCKLVASKNVLNKYSICVLKTVLLQCMTCGDLYMANLSKITREILTLLKNNKRNRQLVFTSNLYSNKVTTFLISVNGTLHSTVELNILFESFTTEQKLLSWLNNIETSTSIFSSNMFEFLLAIFINDYDERITLKIIHILLKIVERYKEYTLQMLPLIIHKLSKTSNPETVFSLLKTLPKMATMKENIPTILFTLKTFQKGNIFELKCFAIRLYYDLWEVNERFYPNLINSLGIVDQKLRSSQLWEAYITKANILKNICYKEPHRHGRELVQHLSDVLVKYKCHNCNCSKTAEKCNAVVRALTIDGIKALSIQDIVTFDSVVLELEKSLHMENDPKILSSWCSFLSEGSNYAPSDVIDESLKKLWSYATEENQNIEVVSAAYDALGQFSFSQLSQSLPEQFKYKTSDSNETLGLIHARCWINLLKHYNIEALNVVGNFIIKLVSQEISEFHSKEYHVIGLSEPQYFKLPQHKIIKELQSHIKRELQNWNFSLHREVFLQCLRILSQKYSKPFPPLDWSFLEILVCDRNTKSFCFKIVAHQLQISSSAILFIKKYINDLVASPEDSEEYKIVFEELCYLCNTIPPAILEPLIKKSMTYAFDNVSNNSELLEFLLEQIRNVFSMKELQESNQFVLQQEIVNLGNKIDITDKPSSLLNMLLDVLILLPAYHIENLTKLDDGNTNNQWKLSVQLRCRLATIDSCEFPLKWLNGFVDSKVFNSNHSEYILENIIRIINLCQASDISVKKWILDLMALIQSLVVNENLYKSNLDFLCEVFILGVVVLSGEIIFYSTKEFMSSKDYALRLFSLSINTLVTTFDIWRAAVSQIAEWLFHMLNIQNLSEKYKITFYQGLVVLRHEEGFSVNSNYLKYMGAYSQIDWD